jgi:hypothetical protein
VIGDKREKNSELIRCEWGQTFCDKFEMKEYIDELFKSIKITEQAIPIKKRVWNAILR